MSAELLQPGPEIIKGFLPNGKSSLTMPHSDLSTSVNLAQSSQALRQRKDFVLKGWAARDARSEQMWKKRANIVEKARVSTDYINRLAPAMRRAVNMLFPPDGGYIRIEDLKSQLSQLEISEGALRMNAKRATDNLNAWMSGRSEPPSKREKSTKATIAAADDKKKLTAELKQGTSDTQRVRKKKDKQEWRKEEQFIALARERNVVRFLRWPRQREVVDIAFPLNGGCQPYAQVDWTQAEHPFNSRQAFDDTLARAMKNINKLMEGKAPVKGRRSTRSVVDRFAQADKDRGGIRISKVKQHGVVNIAELKRLAALGFSLNRISNALGISWYTANKVINSESGIKVTKSNRGRPPRKSESIYA